jgi:hypothetical protein
MEQRLVCKVTHRFKGRVVTGKAGIGGSRPPVAAIYFKIFAKAAFNTLIALQ